VANAPRRNPPASKSVFINCPLDDRFKPILRAVVFTIITSGFHPRCTLDATDGAEIRVGKIAAMIGECDWGIHDLSRVEVDAGGVPRFNSEHRPRSAPPLPGAAAIRADYRTFQAEIGALLVPRRLDPGDLTHSDFLFAVRDWIETRAEPA
jgi:hypothetical protein